MFLIFGKVNSSGIYLFKLLHRLYHCLEEEFSFLVVQLSVSESYTDYWVLFKGWTFNYPLVTRPTVFIFIVLQNRLTRGLGPEISLKTCVLFPENWVLPTVDKIYHHSFTMSTFFDCEKYISKELSEGLGHYGWVLFSL